MGFFFAYTISISPIFTLCRLSNYAIFIYYDLSLLILIQSVIQVIYIYIFVGFFALIFYNFINGMTVLDIFSQAHSVLFQCVISNTFIFYFRKDFSIWSILLIWVSSETLIIHVLDFLCLSSVFIMFQYIFLISFQI